MNIYIEPVTPEDKKVVVDMFAAEKDMWPWGMGVQWWRYWEGVKNGKTNEFWAKALVHGRIVGSIHWLVRAKDNVRNLYDMVIAPDMRGKGIGKALVAHIGKPVILKTDSTTPSNLFYQKLGFKKGDTVPTANGDKFMTHYRLE